MNYKLLTGQALDKIDKTIRKTKLSLVNRHYPWGRDFVFDTYRLLGTDIGAIVDAGANIGSISKEFSFYFPACEIYSFEPIKSTFLLLKRRFLNLHKVHPQNLALGAYNGELQIALNAESTINSLVAPPDQSSLIGFETIQVVSLDQFSRSNNIDNIEVLKIDVEGYEFQVLEGASNLMTKSLNVIILEVGYERSLSKVHFSDVEEYMEKRDFQCCGIYDITKSTDKKKLYYSNNLYVRKKILE